MFDFFVSAIDKQMFVYYNQGTKRTNVRKKVHGIYEGCIKKDCFLFTDPEEGNMR